MSLDASEPLEAKSTKPTEPLEAKSTKPTEPLKAESTKLAKAQELFDVAWNTLDDYEQVCTTSAEIQEVLSILHVWRWRLDGVLDRVRALRDTEEKTKELAPWFKDLGVDAICTYYDCERQKGFKSSVWVTHMLLDFPGLGGLDNTTKIDFKCFDGEEFNFELCVSCNHDGFQVEYEDPRCFSIPASQAQETVPPCVWTALGTILPVLVQREAPSGAIPSYIDAWYHGKP